MNLAKNNYEIIAEELQRIIVAKIIKPGEKLETIEKLAKQYHVGRSTIREALSQVYDLNFHLAIAKVTRNPFLQIMMESISAAMSRTIRDSWKFWLYSEEESAARLFEEHQRMLQCIVEELRKGLPM